VLNLSNRPHGFRGPVIVTVVERECSNVTTKSLQKRKTRFLFFSLFWFRSRNWSYPKGCIFTENILDI